MAAAAAGYSGNLYFYQDTNKDPEKSSLEHNNLLTKEYCKIIYLVDKSFMQKLHKLNLIDTAYWQTYSF